MIAHSDTTTPTDSCWDANCVTITMRLGGGVFDNYFLPDVDAGCLDYNPYYSTETLEQEPQQRAAISRDGGFCSDNTDRTYYSRWPHAPPSWLSMLVLTDDGTETLT